MKTMNAIQTEGLTKRYDATVALDSLDLAVAPGEVYGYLGPNGAGKTTTIRLLLGLHRPTAGRAQLFGVDAWSDPVAAHRRDVEPAVGVLLVGGQLDDAAGAVQRPGPGRTGPTRDLPAFADGDDPEEPLGRVGDLEEVADKVAVTLLEDVERHGHAGKRHQAQREDRQQLGHARQRTAQPSAGRRPAASP